MNRFTNLENGKLDSIFTWSEFDIRTFKRIFLIVKVLTFSKFHRKFTSVRVPTINIAVNYL
ncbi:hypothetical protein LEP1GSC082_4066 [Leptospira kirschneri str. H2]|uniref:Uncharacterized protein n=1 Tax=Leptospira kirschneri str. H1 TaxID=1049966 RepID=A0A0E2B690_9LEPT|nr:hypothetical protein LEP1GSC081_2718 [Leptospira kirschneri str. H1]EKO61603.1 hypothetical protein LEP1GSC082_4066 [Leptospira kirschneri str. H2]